MEKMRDKLFFFRKEFACTRFCSCLAAGFMALFIGCGSRDSSCAPVPVRRYENALMRLDTGNLKAGLELMAPEFPLFFDGADLEDSLNILQIRLFINDPVVDELHGRIRQTYDKEDSSRLSKDFGCLFSRIRCLSPSFRIPEVYTYISYLDYAHRILYQDTVLVIGLDLYADGNEALMDEAGIPRYLSSRLNSRYLMPDAARAVALSLIGDAEGDELLAWIVKEGKAMWFMRQVLPKAEPSVLLGYSDADFAWCERNEQAIWQYIVQQDLLFETDPFEYRYFINEGPFNPLLPGSPARLARFVGWKMVDAYMKRSDADWTVLREADPMTVLEESRYKP